MNAHGRKQKHKHKLKLKLKQKKGVATKNTIDPRANLSKDLVLPIERVTEEQQQQKQTLTLADLLQAYGKEVTGVTGSTIITFQQLDRNQPTMEEISAIIEQQHPDFNLKKKVKGILKDFGGELNQKVLISDTTDQSVFGIFK